MKPIVIAKKLCKHYGKNSVLNGINLTINQGEIVGIIGENGAGKSTLLKSILGLTQVKGELEVCGLNPIASQHALMEKVSFVADTAILPKWITPTQLFEYTAAVHPKFDRALAEKFIEKSKIGLNQPVKSMSKGMQTKLHLALASAIDSDLLVLDEPTLGLDILSRQTFYHDLLENHFDDNNTVIITTHQLEEIENVLTRLVLIDNGEILLDMQVEALSERFTWLSTNASNQVSAEAFNPLHHSQSIDSYDYLFDGVDAAQIAHLGKLTTPSLPRIVSTFMTIQQQGVDHV